MRPSDRAWLALGLGVIAYDLTARDGETLSEAVDRYLTVWPTLTRVAIFAVALHVANGLQPWADPLGGAFVVIRRLRRGPPAEHRRPASR